MFSVVIIDMTQVKYGVSLSENMSNVLVVVRKKFSKFSM